MEDGENGLWFRKDKVTMNDEDTRLFLSVKLTFQSGNGDKHLVPVIILSDTVKAMQVLGDDDVHEMADIFRETSDCFQLEFHRAVFKTYFACYTLLTHPATDTTKGSNIVSLRRSALTA